MTLAAKFGIIRRKLNFDEMPREQALFGQGMFVAGAQAAFQILAALSASEKTAEEVRLGWAELQNEIMNAMPKEQTETARKSAPPIILN